MYPNRSILVHSFPPPSLFYSLIIQLISFELNREEVTQRLTQSMTLFQFNLCLLKDQQSQQDYTEGSYREGIETLT